MMKKRIPLILVAVLFVMHLPFLTADPDTNISFSRDAFTDEGLYTAQVRNYLITGTFHLETSDGTVKTPLFSAVMAGWFSVAGINLTFARLIVLLLSLGALYFVTRKDAFLALAMVSLVWLQYTVFHYSHISLAEMLSVSCLFTGWYFMTGKSFASVNLKIVLLTGFFIALAWWFKFQFVYMMAWPVAYFMLAGLYIYFSGTPGIKQLLHQALSSAGTVAAFGLLYWVAWYLPTREFFDFVMKAQASKPFGEGEWFWKMIDFNIENYFLNDSMLPVTILFLVMLAVSPFIIYYNRKNTGSGAAIAGCFLLVPAGTL